MMDRIETDKCQICGESQDVIQKVVGIEGVDKRSVHFKTLQKNGVMYLPQHDFIPVMAIDEREVQADMKKTEKVIQVILDIYSKEARAERVRIAKQLKEIAEFIRCKSDDWGKEQVKHCICPNCVAKDNLLSLVGELERKEELCPTCGDKPITHSEPCYPNE